jgi:uncharacterized membrane protein YGL010W
MRSALQLLTQYAEYHRDRRNIASHFLGVPLIVFAVNALLSRPSFELGGLSLTPGMVLLVPLAIWYVSRNVALGLATTAVVAALLALGHALAQQATATWLGASIGAFVVGWVIQFVGHYYEGRKPAFVDDLIGLLVGPMFVVAEALFALGWNPVLLGEIEAKAGPTHLRELRTHG